MDCQGPTWGLVHEWVVPEISDFNKWLRPGKGDAGDPLTPGWRNPEGVPFILRSYWTANAGSLNLNSWQARKTLWTQRNDHSTVGRESFVGSYKPDFTSLAHQPAVAQKLSHPPSTASQTRDISPRRTFTQTCTYPASVILDPGVQVPIQVLGHPQGDAVHQGRHLPVDALHTHDPTELKEGHNPPPVHPIPEKLLHHRGKASPRGEGRQVQLAGHLGEVAAVATGEVITSLAQGQVDHRWHGAERRPGGGAGGGGQRRRRRGPGGRGGAPGLGGQNARRGGGPRGRGARVSRIPFVAPLRQPIVDVLHHYLSVIIPCSPGVRHPSPEEKQPGTNSNSRPGSRLHGPEGKNSYNPAILLDVLCILGWGGVFSHAEHLILVFPLGMRCRKFLFKFLLDLYFTRHITINYCQYQPTSSVILKS